MHHGEHRWGAAPPLDPPRPDPPEPGGLMPAPNSAEEPLLAWPGAAPVCLA